MLLFPCHTSYISIMSSHFTMLPKYFLTEAMYYLFTKDNENFCLKYCFY